jgi:hypothetical protein
MNDLQNVFFMMVQNSHENLGGVGSTDYDGSPQQRDSVGLGGRDPAWSTTTTLSFSPCFPEIFLKVPYLNVDFFAGFGKKSY